MDFSFNRIAQPFGFQINLFENGSLTGMLSDTGLHARGQFRGGAEYFARPDPQSLSSSDFRMDSEEGSPFAWGEVQEKHIVFPDHEGSYSMQIIDNSFSKEAYRICYRLMMNNKVHCEIRYQPTPEGGWFKRNFGKADDKGQIWLSDALNRDYLLGFILLFTRYLVLRHESSSD